MQMLGREEGRSGEEPSRAEVEAVGVFVCPRRPLSSHYQGIRQMLLLYRCWFDSEPPTLIPSSLLLPTTPPLRPRLLLLHIEHPPPTRRDPTPHPTFCAHAPIRCRVIKIFDATFFFFLIHLLRPVACCMRRDNTSRLTKREKKKEKEAGASRIWSAASVNLSPH